MKQFNRIIPHHTGGGYIPNKTDLAAYHEVIDGEGRVVKGAHDFSANAIGKKLLPGKYAPHTWKLNGGAIGIAVAAMLNGDWDNPWGGLCPVKDVQVAALERRVAQLCALYQIPVTRSTVLTHAEVQPTLRVTQKNKWDFDYAIYEHQHRAVRDPVIIGDAFRSRVSALMREITLGTPLPAPVTKKPIYRQGSFGPGVVDVQRKLNKAGAKLTADGKFGPKTANAVMSFQKSRQLLPDGVVGDTTHEALDLV